MKYSHRDFYFLVAGVLEEHDKGHASAELTLSTIRDLHNNIKAETPINDLSAYAAHSADQCDDPTCSHY